MTENAFGLDWLARLLSIAEQLLLGYCFTLLVRPFLERQKKVRRVWAAYSTAMILLYAINCFPGSSTAVSIGVLAALLVMCCLDRRNYAQKIFLAVTFFSINWLACAITEILYDNLYGYATRTAYMLAHPNLYAPLYVVMCIVHMMLLIPIMLTALWCILKVYVYKSVNMTKKELCMLLAPLMMGIQGFEVIHYYRNFYIIKTGKNMNIYDARALVYYMMSIVVIVVMIGLYQSIKANQEETLRSKLLATQLESIRYHIGQVELLYENIRGIKHDMTNHLLTLERLYAGNKPQEAKTYSASLKKALSTASGEIRSGNPVTDVILQEWKSVTEKKGVLFESDFYYPSETAINAFDISVILNNALQNAVENVSQKGLVSIRSYHRNQAYMIEICNSFSGSLQWDVESGLPMTTKDKADEHGYGLSNIRRVAAKSGMKHSASACC